MSPEEALEWGNVMADSVVLGLYQPMPGQITLAEAKKNAQEAAKKGAEAKKAADAKKLAQAKAAAAAKQAADAAAAAAAAKAQAAAGSGVNWKKVLIGAGVVLVAGGVVVGGVWYATRK